MAIDINTYEDLIQEVQNAPSLYAIEVLLKNCLSANVVHFEDKTKDDVEVLKQAKETIISDLIKYQHTETPVFFFTSKFGVFGTSIC